MMPSFFSLFSIAEKTTLVLLLVSSLALGACAQKNRLLFHAGVGQRSSLDEIKRLFEARHPSSKVNFSYKGSGYFIADIARSHQGDLYMPGEEFYLLQAVERSFVTDYDPQRDIAAYFVTVILTPRGNPKHIRTIEDFARPGVRVGLGNPKACAIGLWHEKIFKKAGIWDAVKKNAAFSAKCIPELGNAAQHRLIDATIVWATTAVLYLRDCEIIPLDRRYRGVIRLPVATLAFSKHDREAKELKALILSEEGKRIFRSHAYAVGSISRDSEGFLSPDDPSTDKLMTWLVNAAAVVKGSVTTTRKKPKGSTLREVGPLLPEVLRQQKTYRSGS